MKLTDCFERLYIIHLPYRQDRRQRLEGHLAERELADPGRVRWQRAVAGNVCGAPSWFEAGAGAWGCLQSHLRIAQDALMDGIESYCVLEDDVVFGERSSLLLDHLWPSLPQDWGQLYLGGQHLQEPEPLAGHSPLARCRNVNRTHAYALHQRAYVAFQQHIMHFPDYRERGAWHIDHQLGLAHERGLWPTYAPLWWLAGQEAGESNISGRGNPRLWWHPSRYSRGLPFVHLAPGASPETIASLRGMVHFGNHLKGGSCEDIGLDACVGDPGRLPPWLAMIAREAMDRGLLPGLHHVAIAAEEVAARWPAGVRDAADPGLPELLDYPFNGLFPHPLHPGGGDLAAASSAA